jgi:hypothetical protein
LQNEPNFSRHAFKATGVEFTDENDGGPGVRLQKPALVKPKKK